MPFANTIINLKTKQKKNPTTLAKTKEKERDENNVHFQHEIAMISFFGLPILGETGVERRE